MSEQIPNGSWIHWKDRAVFSLSGPDRVRYLNGQVTNRIDQDLTNKTIAACVCSLKGKVEALVWITELDGRILIDGELRQREFLAERLDRYLIADDCELEDVTADWRLYHRIGDLSADGRESSRLSAAGEDIWKRSTDDAPEWPVESEMSSDAFQLLKIRSMLPESDAEITGNEFPSELGLDRWAVDFHKGCYLGQEVISRIESVGKTKRSLVRFLSKEPLIPGAKIFEAKHQWEILRSQLIVPEGVHEGLAMQSPVKKDLPPEFSQANEFTVIEEPFMRTPTND